MGKVETLYAYFWGEKLDYVGTAEEKNVRRRFTSASKKNKKKLYNWLVGRREMNIDSLEILVGILQAEAGHRGT